MPKKSVEYYKPGSWVYYVSDNSKIKKGQITRVEIKDYEGVGKVKPIYTIQVNKYSKINNVVKKVVAKNEEELFEKMISQEYD